MYPSGNKTRYRFKAIVFPANAVLNSIMKMGFFRDVVKSKISEIIKNISESSESYVNGNHEPVKKSETIKKYYTKNLEEFQQVAAGKIPWTVGDAVKKKREESQRQKPQFVTETQMIFKQNFPAK